MLKCLLESYDKWDMNLIHQRKTPLMKAVAYSPCEISLEVVELLVKYKSNLNFVNDRSRSALHYAGGRSSDPDLSCDLAYLLDSGGDLILGNPTASLSSRCVASGDLQTFLLVDEYVVPGPTRI